MMTWPSPLTKSLEPPLIELRAPEKVFTPRRVMTRRRCCSAPTSWIISTRKYNKCMAGGLRGVQTRTLPVVAAPMLAVFNRKIALHKN